MFLLAGAELDKSLLLVLSMSQDEKAIQLAETLREAGRSVVLLTDKSPSKALDYANAKNIKEVVFVGEEEVKSRKYTLKNMKTGKEKKLSEKEFIELC